MMSGAILTETVFNWPGIGYTIFLSINKRDWPVVIGATIIVTFVFLVINLIVDIGYAFLDPRIRYGEFAGGVRRCQWTRRPRSTPPRDKSANLRSSTSSRPAACRSARSRRREAASRTLWGDAWYRLSTQQARGRRARSISRSSWCSR